MAEAGAWSSTCASRPLVRKSPPSLSSSRGHFYLAPNGPFTWWRHDLDAGCTCTEQCLPSPQLARRRGRSRGVRSLRDPAFSAVREHPEFERVASEARSFEGSARRAFEEAGGRRLLRM